MVHLMFSKAVRRFFPRYVPASAQPGRYLDYPTVEQKSVENAKLFASREDLLTYFAPELTHGTIAEIGVMYGDFSEFILRKLDPASFIAIDRFNAHIYPTIWGKSSQERFKGKTHLEYFRNRLSNWNSALRCEQGESWECLSRCQDQSFDMIYIDAGHDLESVRKDADVAQRKIKRAGLIIFNDYIKYSHYDDCYYGVVPAVNGLVARNGFEVAGFALQPDMYCDIAIRKAP